MTEKCCDKRKYPRGQKDVDLINKRINRLIGQMEGIKKMINNDTYCNEVLIELAAVEKALKNLTNLILEDHLYSCIASDLEEGKINSVEEIISLFKRFNK